MALALVLLLAACSSAATPSEPPVSDPASTAPTSAPAADPAAPVVVPLEEIRARSSCAFDSIAALCDGLREHAGSSDDAWVSDGCAIGPRRTTRGAFAEAALVAIHAGSGGRRAERVERPLLGTTVREQPSNDATTHVVLAARVGAAWFPIHLFHPIRGEVDPASLAWDVDDDGRALTWSDEEAGSRRDDPSGYGSVERTIAVVDRGVPVIAAQATIERWRGEVDLDCTRACNGEPSPPPYPGCERRCASSVRATRTWERDGDTIRLGATVVERTGTNAAIEIEREEARTIRLADFDPGMRFCAFLPVVHATPPAARTDAASIALRDRARALLERGAGTEVPGAREAAQPGAARSLVAIDAQLGGACGGGGCTIGLRYRTLDGTLPEQGLHYFASDRGTGAGCAATALPSGPAPTLVEVAPARDREAIACGFAGWDGSAERHFVITRVLE